MKPSALTTLDRSDYRVTHLPPQGGKAKRARGGQIAIINRMTGEVIGRGQTYQQAVTKLEAALTKERRRRQHLEE